MVQHTQTIHRLLSANCLSVFDQFVELSISPYTLRMWENTDQENSQYEHFSRSDNFHNFIERCKTILDEW